jgi:UDP-N-acetylglucosamine 2-epimerase (non-hydrolysing)
VGTRPEAIKLAPVVWALRESEELRPWVAYTGQHRDLLTPLLEILEIDGGEEVGDIEPGLPLTTVFARTNEAVGELLRRRSAEAIVVQGDTAPVLSAAIAAFHERVRVIHVEAGLRSGDFERPFPEEMHRRVVAELASLHLAPTPGARVNLLAEGVPADRILVTGNTAVDALRAACGRMPPYPREGDGPLIVVTVHRRESWHRSVREIAAAVADIAREHPDAEIVAPIHPNPQVHSPFEAELGPLPNASIVEPLRYDRFLGLLAEADLVLTDSGGIQEETPSLGTPVLLLRDRTERPEALDGGFVRVAGTHRGPIVEATREALRAGWRTPDAPNPFGDGQAAERIVSAMELLLDGKSWPALPVEDVA